MKNEVLKEVDETIVLLCKKVRQDQVMSGNYAETVKALATLVEARAKLS